MFKLGVVGLGAGISRAKKILAHETDWELTAIVDAMEDRVQDFTAAHPQVRGFIDFKEFLAQAELDGVMIVVPHDLHMPMTVAALEAGKHVLVEKPMARNVDECRKMIDAAGKHGKTLMVAHQWRYSPWLRTVKAVVDSGELGPLRAIRSDWAMNIVVNRRAGSWLLDGERAGGGPIITLMAHCFDFFRYLMGEPESVQAYCLRGHPEFSNNAENWAMAQIQFENGVIGQMFTSYSAYSPVDAGRLWLYGEEGTIYLKEESLLISSVKRGDEYVPIEIEDNAGLPTGDPHVNELLHFVQCAQSGVEPVSSGRDTIKTIRFIDAIYEADRTGERVKVNADRV